MHAPKDDLARLFEDHRTHLRAIAYRILGSRGAADDAVQQSWIRLCKADAQSIDDLRGWLTVVVRRICLDIVRARNARREGVQALRNSNRDGSAAAAGDPERDMIVGERVALAMAVVLEKLTPSQRVPFVLHDAFALPFEDIARLVRSSPAAVRKQASRARQVVRDAAPFADVDRMGRSEVVDAFLAAAHRGDFAMLLKALDPEGAVGYGADSGREDGDRGYLDSALSETVLKDALPLYGPPAYVSDSGIDRTIAELWPMNGAEPFEWVLDMNALAEHI